MKRIIQIVVEEINKIMLYIFCFFIICISLIGCSSSNTNDNNCLKLDILDSTMFLDYNLIYFLNNKDEQIYVISEKNRYNNFNDSNYVKMDTLNIYCIDLIRQDSFINATVAYQIDRGGGAQIILENIKDTVLLWDTGKLMVPVNKSNDIKGLFVLKEKTRNKTHR